MFSFLLYATEKRRKNAKQSQWNKQLNGQKVFCSIFQCVSFSHFLFEFHIFAANINLFVDIFFFGITWAYERSTFALNEIDHSKWWLHILCMCKPTLRVKKKPAYDLFGCTQMKTWRMLAPYKKRKKTLTWAPTWAVLFSMLLLLLLLLLNTTIKIHKSSTPMCSLSRRQYQFFLRYCLLFSHVVALIGFIRKEDDDNNNNNTNNKKRKKMTNPREG